MNRRNQIMKIVTNSYDLDNKSCSKIIPVVLNFIVNYHAGGKEP